MEGLAVGDAVAEEVPTRLILAYGSCGASFVVAVVPFDQVRCDLGGGQTGQFGRSRSPGKRADQDIDELSPVEALGQAGTLNLAVRRQRNIRAAGMAPISAPGSFAVADEDDSSSGNVHPCSRPLRIHEAQTERLTNSCVTRQRNRIPEPGMYGKVPALHPVQVRPG